MCKVSVIIPVYNAEKTIDKCITSILKQAFEDYEIIVINDGSTDSSLKILKNYEKKLNNKIKVIHQKNQGVSKTRNNALKIAQGKYIIFIDNDDYLDNEYLANYVQEIEANDLDVVIGGYRRITDENKILESKYPKNNDWGKLTIITPWAKIFKRKFLLDNKIEFLDYGIGEDIYFYLQVLDKTDKVGVTKYIGYNWFYNTKSISNTNHKGFNKNIDILFLVKELRKKIKGHGNISNEIIQYYYIRLIIWYLLYSGSSASSKDFIEQYNYLFQYLKKDFPNYRKIILFQMPKNEIIKIKWILRLFIFLDKLKLVKLFSKLYCKGSEIND